MISDTLSDACREISRYLSDDTFDYSGLALDDIELLLSHMTLVRKRLDGDHYTLDTAVTKE